ncbi:MAG: hypothetical protein P1V18_01135 [Candidatus Gracilibacteria bacterium]|nr:hypothetical protein [Candidatus Gracilibacteria bacterium]
MKSNTLPVPSLEEAIQDKDCFLRVMSDESFAELNECLQNFRAQLETATSALSADIAELEASQSPTHHEPREVALPGEEVRRIVLDQNHLYISSEKGQQKFLLRERDLELKELNCSDPLSVPQLTLGADKADIRSIIEFAENIYLFTDSKEWKGNASRISPVEGLKLGNTGVEILPKTTGPSEDPQDSIVLKSAGNTGDTLWKKQGRVLLKIEQSGAINEQGGIVRLTIEHAEANFGVDDETNIQSDDIIAVIDSSGKILQICDESKNTFEKCQVSTSLEFVSLGPSLYILNNGVPEILNTNGEIITGFEKSFTLGDVVCYVFSCSGQGQISVFYNTQSGKIEKSFNYETRLVSAAGFFHDESERTFYQLGTADEKGRLKSLIAITLPEKIDRGSVILEDEEEKRIQELAESQLRIISSNGSLPHASEQFSRTTSILDFKNELKPFISDIRVKRIYAVVDETSKRIERLVRTSLGLLSKRNGQREKLKEFKETFLSAYEMLPEENDQVGTTVQRIQEYVRLRNTLQTEISDQDLIPEAERAELFEQLTLEGDKILHTDRKNLTELLVGLDGELERHLEEGKKILTNAMTATPPNGYIRVQEAIQQFEAWKGFQQVFLKIQSDLDVFFGSPDDKVEGKDPSATQRFRRKTKIEKAKDLFKAAFTKTRTDGIKKTDIEKFTLAHIQAFAEEILLDAREQNIDPDREQRFTSQMEYLAGQIETLADKDSEADIERAARDIQKELTELNQYRQDSRLFSEQLTRISDQLEGSVQRAKEIAGEMKTERARTREKQLFTDIKAFGKEAAVAVQYEKREGATADQLSMQAMRRVTALFRGFDLNKQNRVSRIPESECSDSMLRLFKALEKFQSDYPEKTQKMDEFWDQLRYIRNQAIRDVEIEKGFHYKPGYYVMKFPEFFKSIEPSMGDLEIKLSGREYSGDIKIKTKPVWTASGLPSLQMSVLGTAFSKEMPYISNTTDALDAARVFYWESPAKEGMSDELTREGREAITPKIAREEMAAYFLIKRLLSEKGSKRLKRKMSRLVKLQRDKKMSPSSTQVQEVYGDLEKMLTGKGKGIIATYSMELNNDHLHDIICLVVALWPEKIPSDLESFLQEENDHEKKVPGLKSQHPVLNRIEYTISRKELFTRAQEFEEDFGEPLMDMHQYIQRNEERIKNRFMIGNLNKQNTLVETYRPTIHDFIRLKELNDRIEMIKLSPDRNVVVFCGAPGSGKTTLLLALTKYSKNTMMMVQGNNAKNARSLDPQNAETAAEKEILTQLSAGLLGFGDGDFVVIDEAPFMFNLFNTSHQVLDARRRLNITLDDIPNPEKSLDIDIFERGINTYKKGSINWIWIGNKVAELDPVIETRVETIDDDKLCSDHQAAWFISYLEKSSSDLGLHPDDVKLIAYKRLTDPVRKTPLEVDKDELKTDFYDSQELEEVIKTIDNRLMAARIIAQIQMEAWDTYEYRKTPYKLGKPPCNLHSVGARDLQGIMPLINYELDKPSDVGRMMYQTIKKNKNCSPEDLLILARITGCHDEFGIVDFENAKQEAIDRKIIGEAPNPTVASLKLITNRLDTLNEKISDFAGTATQNTSNQVQFNTSIEKIFINLQQHIQTIQQAAPIQAKAMLAALKEMTSMATNGESAGKEERAVQLQHITTQTQKLTEMVAYIGKISEAAIVLPGGNIERPDFETEKVAGGDMNFDDDDDDLG